MSIRETFQSFSIGPCTSSAASRNDQLGARIFWFFSKSNSGRLLCMLMTWPGLTIETPSGVPPPPLGFTLDHSSRCSNICILIWSCSQLFLYRFDSRQDCWENILSWIEKLRYVCWQCGENVFSFQWKKLNSADDCWKVKEYQLKWKGLFLNICLFHAGPVVHSIVLGSWRCINFDFSSYEF